MATGMPGILKASRHCHAEPDDRDAIGPVGGRTRLGASEKVSQPVPIVEKSPQRLFGIVTPLHMNGSPDTAKTLLLPGLHGDLGG